MSSGGIRSFSPDSPIFPLKDDSQKKTITFLTGHYYLSQRRAGFHNLADAAHKAGHKVNFVTVGYSLLSFLRRDYRTRIPGIHANCNRAIEIKQGFSSYVYFTPWHPHTLVLPFLDRLTMSCMDSYGERELGDLLPLVQDTDIFVYESMCALFLFRRFRKENPSAQTIYRVSDDIRILGSTHPRLVELERELAPQFDCLSVPSSVMLDLFPGLANLRLDRHGLDKAAYDACTVSPYEPGTKNAVFVGTGYMDSDYIKEAAKGNPDCSFHIIGAFSDEIQLQNVHFHGEMPFLKTIPYVKFADVGLHTLKCRKERGKSFTDSLKIIQYRYCGLPIVSPDSIKLARDGVFYYQPGDGRSCVQALRNALLVGKDSARAGEVHSWDEVFQAILGSLERRA